jgi:YidC/Oxa1 family membrane protein insertase
MDRNTIIGLTLIGVILVVFTLFNQPSAEDLKKQKAQTEAAAKKKEKADEAAEKVADEKAAAAEKKEAEQKLAKAGYVAQKDAAGKTVVDAKGNTVYAKGDKTATVATIIEEEQQTRDSIAAVTKKPDFQGETIRLESDKIIADFSTKGGMIEAIQLKEFETYHNFQKNDGKITPLYLFEKGDQVNELAFQLDGK